MKLDRTPMLSREGFTLLELMIVIAIMGVITALTVPALWRYAVAQDARSNAHQVASALRLARERSMREGVQYVVLFGAPASAAGAVARVIRDVDLDFVESAPDVANDVFFRPGTSQDVTPYGVGPQTPFPAAPLAPADPQPGNLGAVANGASFKIDPNTGVPGVGFTARGVPVDLANPGSWGSGAGAYYVTDNVDSVYAAEVGPLGEVRVRSLSGATNDWR
jgi:prepilin-type N-terminal cleavage/methylation domain-containing protein